MCLYVLMYAVLHGIAQIPVGKAQNLAQNELKPFHIVMSTGTCVLICVDVCCFACNSSNSSGDRLKI